MWPNSPLKRGPLVVANLQKAVLDAERLVKILAEVVVRELDQPVVEVPTVEQLHPRLGVGIVPLRGEPATLGRSRQGQKAEDNECCPARLESCRHRPACP